MTQVIAGRTDEIGVLDRFLDDDLLGAPLPAH